MKFVKNLFNILGVISYNYFAVNNFTLWTGCVLYDNGLKLI